MAERQIVDIDTVGLGHQDRALDRMAELADVAGPLIGAQRVQCGARNLLDVLAEQPIVVLDKMGDEGRDRFAPFAQRRNQDGGRIEPIVQVVAELPRLDHRAQVAIGRRDQPDIDLVLCDEPTG